MKTQYPTEYTCLSVCMCVFVCACIPVHTCVHVWLFATPWTIADQTPLSLGFSRQEYWSELPFPPPGDLPDSLPTEPQGKYISLCVLNSYSSLDLGSKESVFFQGVFPECLLMLWSSLSSEDTVKTVLQGRLLPAQHLSFRGPYSTWNHTSARTRWRSW